MKRTTSLVVTLAALTLLAIGCTASQIAKYQQVDAAANSAYAASTQATATAQTALATVPPTAPGYKAATQAVAESQSVEQKAKLALDVANAALAVAQNGNASNPDLAKAVTAAVSVIPSPYTPLIAALVPLAIAGAGAAVQSYKLGKAHQQVASITSDLNDHKEALAHVMSQVDGQGEKSNTSTAAATAKPAGA